MRNYLLSTINILISLLKKGVSTTQFLRRSLQNRLKNIGGGIFIIWGCYTKKVLLKPVFKLLLQRRVLQHRCRKLYIMKLYTATPFVNTSFLELSRQHDFNIETAVGINSNGDVHNLCLGLSSISINDHLEDSYFTPDSEKLPFAKSPRQKSVKVFLCKTGWFHEWGI